MDIITCLQLVQPHGVIVSEKGGGVEGFSTSHPELSLTDAQAFPAEEHIFSVTHVPQQFVL